MDQSLQNNSSDDGFNAERVLSDWLRAIAALHTNYNELVRLLNGNKVVAKLNKENTMHIGLCSLNSLQTLALTIEGEMEKLVQEMDQLDWLRQQTSRHHYKKLIDHTLLLNQLNHKVQLKLHLISIAPS